MKIKKLIISLCLLAFTVSLSAQVSGWKKTRGEKTEQDSVNFVKRPLTGTTGQNVLATRQEINDSIQLYITNGETGQALSDSRTLMTFGAGGGNAGDTTAFTTSTIYGSVYWGGPLTFHVDSMIVSMVHGVGLDTLGVQISWSDTLKAVVPVNINTAALAVGRAAGVNKALTVGQVDASFNNATIPPGKMVWCTTPYVPADALKRKPTYLGVSLIGHLQ